MKTTGVALLLFAACHHSSGGNVDAGGGVAVDASVDAAPPSCAGWLCPNAQTGAILPLSTGELVVAGRFSSALALEVGGVAVGNADGSVAVAFPAHPFAGYVTQVSQAHDTNGLPTGKLFALGALSANGEESFFRANADGSADSTFTLGSCSAGYLTVFAEERAMDGKPDGKIVLAGNCSAYNGAAVPAGLFRLNADGSVDASFNAAGAGLGPPSSANAYRLLQERATDGSFDGNWIVGGSFQTYNGASAPPGLIRVSSTGALDTTYNHGGSATGGFVLALEQQLDTSGMPTGNLFVGTSDATGYNSVAAPDGLFEVSASGARVTAFQPSLGFATRTTAILTELGANGLPTGKLIVAGSLPEQATYLSKIVRIDAMTGVRDASYNAVDATLENDRSVADADAYILESDLDLSSGMPSGETLVASAAPSWGGTPIPVGLLKLKSDGTVDGTSSAPGFDTAPQSLELERDTSNHLTGQILFGGPVFYAASSISPGVVRLNSAHKLDTTFSACTAGFDPSAYIPSAAEEASASGPTGNIIVAGKFREYCGVEVHNLARIKRDGSLDTTFRNGAPSTGPFATAQVSAVTIERGNDGTATGKIFVAGDFASYDGVSPTKYLVRINSDGSLDSTFNTGGSGPDDDSLQSVVQELGTDSLPTGRLFIAGFVTTYNGAPVPRGLVRLNGDGTVDTTYNAGQAGVDDEVAQVTIERDTSGAPTGNLLVIGGFAHYNGTAVGNVARILPSGALDTTFNPGGSGIAQLSNDFIVQELGANDLPTGNLYLTGSMTKYNGVNVPYGLIRVDRNGALDTTFNAGGVGLDQDDGVTATVMAPNGGPLLISGPIQSYNGLAAPYWLCVSPDGSLDTSCSAGLAQ